MFLEISQNSQENTCARDFIKKETLTQVFTCEFCEISKNTFFTEYLRAAASVIRKLRADIRFACIVHSKFQRN